MMDWQNDGQVKLFYEFCLEDRVPAKSVLILPLRRKTLRLSSSITSKDQLFAAGRLDCMSDARIVERVYRGPVDDLDARRRLDKLGESGSPHAVARCRCDDDWQLQRRTVGAIGGQIIRLQAEAILYSLKHGASSADLGLANGARGFVIDNHPVVGIDQIIGGISKKGMALVRPVHWAAGSEAN